MRFEQGEQIAFEESDSAGDDVECRRFVLRRQAAFGEMSVAVTAAPGSCLARVMGMMPEPVQRSRIAGPVPAFAGPNRVFGGRAG